MRRQYANEAKPKDTKNHEPKILNENPPAGGRESEDVRRHNEELEQRAEKAHEKVSNEEAEKVGL